MNKIILFASFLFIALSGIQVQAQGPRTIELKPIQIRGTRYYYDFKMLRAGAFALQIPLQSLDDAEVNRRYRNFNTLTTVGQVAYLVPLAYFLGILLGNNATTVNNFEDTYLTLFLGAAAVNIGTGIAARSQIRKAVDRYNLIVLRGTTIGMQMERIPNSQMLAGLTIRHRLK